MSSVVQLPAKLPQIAESGFPVSYEAAKQAIIACESPIECRTMADKAAAMAVYAKLRDDSELHNRAIRLQAWATRRWGELDRELHPDRSRSNLKQNQADSPDCGGSHSGKRPAPLDGTTEHQRVVSRRLAAVPEAEFTRQVESAKPPTVTQLANQGKVARAAQPTDSIRESKLPSACAALIEFARQCEQHHPELIARTLDSDVAARLRPVVAKVERWLTQFDRGLGSEEASQNG